MPLVKRRNYGIVPVENDAGFVLAPSTARLGHQVTGPASHLDATMLRTRSSLRLSVTVGLPGMDIPSEGWWHSAQVYLFAVWHPTTVSTPPDPVSGTDEHFLGVTVLQKRMTPSASSPTEYGVEFFTDDDLVTQTSRKSTSVTTVPCVNFWIGVYDPSFTITGGFTAVTVQDFLTYYVLWGSPT